MSTLKDWTAVPEKERDVDGLTYFRGLPERAKETNWGLQDMEKAVLNLGYRAVFAEVALDGTQLEQQQLADANKELSKRVKGLELTVARYKKQLSQLRD
jgi:hypothetical protein